jgi:tRNA-dihydrouridine synthase B
MVSAVALSHHGAKTLGLLQTDPAIEKPLAVQLFGKDSETLARAAQIAVEQGAEIIDLNFGCPARKVVSSGHGAAILKDHDLAENLAQAVVKATSAPVTVKTRLAWAPGYPDIFSLAKRLEGVGVAALTVHGRFGTQGFLGQADWEPLARLAEEIHIPLIGSGDVTEPDQAVKLLKETGVAAIMIGRAARGRPWFFRQCLDLWRGQEPWEPTWAERLQVALDHAQWLHETMGPRAAFKLRTVLMWYARETPGAAAIRQAINRETAVEKQLEILKSLFVPLT